MLQKFYPDAYFASAYCIDYDGLYHAGYRGIIFDIDNTLVPHGAPADKRSTALIAYLKKLGFGVLLLSNNKEPRVKKFNDVVQVQYIFKAGKPMRANYIKAMERLGTTRENTVFIGDQFFTDIWGAKNAGIRSYLVQPIDKKEEIQIVLKRYLEKLVLYGYRSACMREGKEFLQKGLEKTSW